MTGSLGGADLDAIEAHFTTARRTRWEWEAWLQSDGDREIEALIAALREARALLRASEYAGCAHENGAVCRHCGAGDWEASGHRPLCELAAALGLDGAQGARHDAQ